MYNHSMNQMRRSVLVLTAVAAVILVLPTAPAIATSSSSNYKINEDFVGPGGGTSSSTNYQVSDTVGAASIGEAMGNAYRVFSGVPTPDEPRLAFSVDTSSVDLGTLSIGSTATGEAYFSVLNYTSFGYIVQVVGNPPTYGSHSLSALTSPTGPSAGTEQFGINTVANTSPSSFGNDPQQVPDNTFSFGTAASGYDTANLYKYVSGNTIAQAVKQSGQTTFTISFIANISTVTPGGSYSTSLNLIATGTY